MRRGANLGEVRGAARAESRRRGHMPAVSGLYPESGPVVADIHRSEDAGPLSAQRGVTSDHSFRLSGSGLARDQVLQCAPGQVP